MNNKVKNLKTDGNYKEAFDLQTKIFDINKNYNKFNSEKKILNSRIETLVNRKNNLVFPTPPKTEGFQLSNGEFDAKGYEKAYARYEQQVTKYNRIQNKIEKQLTQVCERLASIEEKLFDINSELKSML